MLPKLARSTNSAQPTSFYGIKTFQSAVNVQEYRSNKEVHWEKTSVRSIRVLGCCCLLFLFGCVATYTSFDEIGLTC